MSSGATIVIGSLVMALVALVGGITLVLPPWRLQQLLAPLVSLAAGSLLGGALFHHPTQLINSSDWSVS